MAYIEKESVMKSMLEILQGRMRHYGEVRSRDTANIYLGELHGYELFFNIVAARGLYDAEIGKINDKFRQELDDASQILSKKFESGELK